jgi:hypothetical protein
MEQTECSETSTYKNQTPGNYPEESIQHISLPDSYNGMKDEFFIPTRLWRWNRQSVPKRRHIKIRRRGITQKKAYNIFHYLIHITVWRMNPSYLSVYEDGTECSETSAYKIQTPGNHPEKSIQHLSLPDSYNGIKDEAFIPIRLWRWNRVFRNVGI